MLVVAGLGTDIPVVVAEALAHHLSPLQTLCGEGDRSCKRWYIVSRESLFSSNINRTQHRHALVAQSIRISGLNEPHENFKERDGGEALC